MKAPSVRAAASAYTSEQLAAAIEAIAEQGEESTDVTVEGDDLGEKLTHLLLAARIRSRVDAGEELKDAFRAEMAAVRETLANS